MALRPVISNPPVCIWMSAGVLTYKLCPRNYECDSCPLDVALREGARARWEPTVLCRKSGTVTFPEDLLFTSSHTWLQRRPSLGDSVFRFGLDAFAAGLIGRVDGVRYLNGRSSYVRGQTVCQIDLGLGLVDVRMPVDGHSVKPNSVLGQNPEKIVTEPYSSGWVLEFGAESPSQLGDLMESEEVRSQTLHDLFHFRKRIALDLLAEDQAVGATLQDGGEVVADLRQLLGGSCYLALIRELIC